MSSHKTGREQHEVSSFVSVERFHPYRTFLFFSIVGSAVLFLGICLLYAIKRSADLRVDGFQLPKSFILSTIVMLFSSYSLTHSLQAFKTDQVKKLAASLTATFVFSMFFIALQAFGWYQLYRAGFFINSPSAVAFLYMLTGLHFLHVMFGIVYLLSCMIKVYSARRDMVKSLMFFSDRYQQTKIELLNIYWHYVDFLWLGLFMMFLFTL